jgi:hypothetical protein
MYFFQNEKYRKPNKPQIVNSIVKHKRIKIVINEIVSKIRSGINAFTFQHVFIYDGYHISILIAILLMIIISICTLVLVQVAVLKG